jgi:hypothetical protein
MIPRWNIVLNALIGRFDHQVNAILVEQQINKYKNLVTLCKNEGKQIPDNFTFSNESLISLIEEREELKKQYKELKAEYSDIVSSRLYKLFNSVRPFLKRISRFK